MALATEEEEEPNQTIDGWIQISREIHDKID